MTGGAPLFDGPGPRVFGVPPGADFAGDLVRGLMDRLAGAPPEALAGVEIAVNTQRILRAATEAFEARAAAGAAYLPRLTPLDRLGAGYAAGFGGDPGAASGAPPPPAEDRLTRRLTLIRLVERRLAADPRLGPPGAAGALAKSLAALLDEMQRERVGFDALGDALGDETSPEIAEYWGETLSFLEVIGRLWPGLLAAEPARTDPEARRAAEVDALLAAWAADPPKRPLLVAGSTGSQRLTADIMTAVAALPQGALILPGFDFALDAAAWAEAGPDHPQYGFKRLLDRLDLAPDAVARWRPEAREERAAGEAGAADRPSAPRAARARLLAQALRPAPVTHEWRDALPGLTADAATATAGLSLIEAPLPGREAEAIAAVMRGALEHTDRVAALVTPDRTLARRVAAALGRWGLTPDDSSGRPVALTPPGVFLTMVAAALSGPYDPVATLALLKHPLTAEGAGRAAHLRAVGLFETRILRNRQRALGLTTLADAAEACFADAEAAAAEKAAGRERPPDTHAEPQARAAAAGSATAEGAPASGAAPVADHPLAGAFDALAPWPAGEAPLAARVADLRRAAVALAGAGLWTRGAGEAAEAALARFEASAADFGAVEPGAFPALLAAALDEAGDAPEEAFLAHPRLKIWGTLEARAQTADIVILGGLNEGTWPQRPAIDPWLSRPMRARAGLPAPERRVGLSAHDFLHCASAGEVVLTRSLKAGGAPTTPSRWLARLTTLLSGLADGEALAEMKRRGAAWLAAAGAAEPNLAPATGPAPRPEPRPPLAARPRKLWVTDIEALIRDPYTVYARRVLGLRRLGDLVAAPDARLRGEALHLVMQRLVEETKAEWPDPAKAGDLYDRIAESTLADIGAPPAATLAWAARLERIKPWFMAEEAFRRAYAAPVGVELAGETTIRAGAAPFVIAGRADRIDALHEGGYAIYDYKAGKAPSERQVAVFAKQMPLLALIAEAGGFVVRESGGAPPRAAPPGPVRRLSYLSLTGKDEGGVEKSVALEEDAARGLAALIEAFDDPARAYLPRAYPEMMDYASDYDHLSRHGEWDDRFASASEGATP